MARTASERQRRALTAKLRERGALSSTKVEAAFQAVAREAFLPRTLEEGGLEAVYRDDAITTKRGAQGLPVSSSSQPAIMSLMLELLEVQTGEHVLEIGAGTGYNAALLAHLTGPSGRVTSIDIDAGLAREARRALKDAGVRATIIAGDGRDGHAKRAPYDRIIVTASTDQIPRAWTEQLRDGGRLVAPVRLDLDNGALQLIPAFERRGDTLRSVGMTWGGFMPLHNGGWRPPVANLSAVHTANGQHTGLASLSGPGLAQLSQPAVRELLIALLDKPDTPLRRGVTNLGARQPPLLLLYLMLNIPPDRRLAMHQRGRRGIGLVDRKSQSTAIVSLRSPWNENGNRPQARARWRLDAYGGDNAANELNQLLTEWRELERAGRTTLCVTARGRGETMRLTFAWTDSGA
jgi:protein-L-isoaspartate(D-aspartate) O-methyltransferase